LTSVLHADRWDYPYYFKPGYCDAQERKFTVWFENDRLVRWEGDQQPALQPFQLDAAGNPAQEKIDEEIDAETARRDAQGADRVAPAAPAAPARLPPLGTPPGGMHPAESAAPAMRAPDMQGPGPAPAPADTPPPRRELLINSPLTQPSPIGQPGGGAVPLR